MRVIATARGYDNTATREPGEEFDIDVDPKVFDLPPGRKPSWYVPVRAVKAAESAPRRGRGDRGEAEQD